MRNVSNKTCLQNLFTNLKLTIYFQKIFSEIPAVYEIMNKNMAKPDRTQKEI